MNRKDLYKWAKRQGKYAETLSDIAIFQHNLRSLYRELESKFYTIPEKLRPSKPSDIVQGKRVFLECKDDPEYLSGYAVKLIEEVLYPADTWKAFIADDGCRYGHYHLFVEDKSDVDNENT